MGRRNILSGRGFTMRDIAYLKLLAREYPTIRAASSEIINLTAIGGLPKGTEYFFSDLHGEHEAFIHLVRSSSGIIREKIKETFGYVIPEEEQEELANLIYYPQRRISLILSMSCFMWITMMRIRKYTTARLSAPLSILISLINLYVPCVN